MKNILFTGVFGPYAQNDKYGSRKINPMELFHNQVTREQGVFSIRMFHPTHGLRFIAANLDSPVTILDFPTQERFIEEIRKNRYDIIGINSIMCNNLKVKRMCELVREYSHGSEIVVGGPISMLPDIEKEIDADHIVKGDGLSWFRNHLGEREKGLKHPVIKASFGTRVLGLTVPFYGNSAVLIPTLGCPMGCNFCLTSAMFGGKGKSVRLFESGEELFSIMCQLEKKLRTNSFFILDENFLLYKERALSLLRLMEKHDKSWSLQPFTSAQVLKSYGIDQLVRLGISWVWIGLEGEGSRYEKLKGIDTRSLVRELQSHGISVLGSTIIGLENHTSNNIQQHIDYSISHNTDFHQFMLYTPVPGTQLYREHSEKGTLYSQEEFPPHDFHGQYRFNYRHPGFRDGEEEHILRGAFQKDFAANGPSLVRRMRTRLSGWNRYKGRDKRVSRRYELDARGLVAESAVVWAAAEYYRNDTAMQKKMKDLLGELYDEFPKTRVAAPVLGRVLAATMRREETRMKNGWTYEPRTLYEKNRAAHEQKKNAALLDSVVPMG